MATIKEDYVSFKTAKLLKEKGFHEDCKCQYGKGGSIAWISCSNGNVTTFARPTIQMTMKWLREVHNLSVEVYRTACGYVGCIVNIPSGTDIKFLEEDGDDLPSGQYTKWEYACEAAIKYCLENLI